MRPASLRRAALLAAGALAVPLTVLVATPTPAHADDSSTLTVVGTSDVKDSNLMAAVIKPGFEAYEQSLGKNVTLNYTGTATGTAINTAESGAASALIVHAASLENSFVSQGFSLEAAGRPFAWGDYVLLGPASGDPAGLLGPDGSPSHDIVGAYEKIAAAGANHQAEFVSRGGVPGTTVQEHAIWALTQGVDTCKVSTDNGGGYVPSTTDVGTDCPSTATPPSWYHTTGLTQGPNVTAADACNGYDSTSCYVFTDKGTYEYLRSQNGGAAVAGLKIVAENNDVPGQENLLVNSFHVYGVNPDAPAFAGKSNVQINTDAAHDLLVWMTSPAGQKAIGDYLADDPDGAPFRPSAAPTLTATTSPTSVTSGQLTQVSGTLANVVPGTPALSGVTVTLEARPANQPGTTPTAVATATTRSDGSYFISYVPKANLTYTVSSPEYKQEEDATLNPPFYDLLQPTSTGAGTVGVTGVVSGFSAADKPATKAHDVRLSGKLSPAAPAGTKIQLFAHRVGGKAGYAAAGSKAVASGASSFNVALPLAKGRYKLEVKYYAPGLQTGTSPAVTVTVS